MAFLGGLGDVMGSGPFGAFADWLGQQQQQRQYEETRQANMQRGNLASGMLGMGEMYPEAGGYRDPFGGYYGGGAPGGIKQQAFNKSIQGGAGSGGYGMTPYGQGGGGYGQYGRVMDRAGQVSQNLMGTSQGYYGGGAPGQRYQAAMGGVEPGWAQLGADVGRQGQEMTRFAREGMRTGLGQLGDVGAGYAARTGAYGQQAQGIAGGYGQRAAQYGGQAQGIAGGYGARTQTGMGMLEGMGAQERQDIGRRFEERGAAAMGDLQARGLRSTTVAPGVSAGIERERAGAMGEFEERMRGQQFGAYTGLTGEALAGRERMMGFGAGLSGEALAGRERMMGFGAGLSGEQLGFGAQAVGMGAGLRGGYLGQLGAQQGVGMGMGAQRLGAMERYGTGQLGYGDYAMQQQLGGMQQYGMMPAGYDIGLTGQALGFAQNIQEPYGSGY